MSDSGCLARAALRTDLHLACVEGPDVGLVLAPGTVGRAGDVPLSCASLAREHAEFSTRAGRARLRVRPGSAPFQPAGRRIPEHPGSGFPWLQAPDRHAAFATFGGTVCDPVNRHQRNDRMAGSRTYRRLPAIGGAPGNRHLTGSRR